MATTFLKSFASGEQCIILEPREALLYTFDFGNWTELRFGFFGSTTLLSENNTTYGTLTNETIVDPAPVSQVYFGFKDSSFSLPYMPGTMFFGPTTVRGGTHGIQSNIDYYFLDGTLNRISLISGSQILNSGLTNLAGASSSPFIAITSAPGSGAYAKGNVVTIRRSPNTFFGTGSFSQFNTDQGGGVNNNNTDFSIFKTRQFISAAQNASARKDSITGYFTNDLNSVFIYSPYMTHRLRIHALVVERYE